ncbi:signal peptidase I [Candidatus Curculioniphilus buchneri]|uniref:signal peptidase I n=1 Tax=Candidatus Curculioniphilus buchneri TaxID=690594 RepID=UPI00376EABC4
MAHIFSLILAIATLITGLCWCVKRIKLMRIYYHRYFMKHNYQVENKKINTGTDIFIQSNSYPKWFESFNSIFPILLLVFIVRSFIFEPFQIPSGSMMPTLLVGDFILVKKFVYGIKNPITQTTLIETGHPKRGDVVVFRYPPNPNLNYIKRVVGLPNDRIRYDFVNKRITIQPNFNNQQYCPMELPITYFDITPKDAINIFESTKTKEIHYYSVIQPLHYQAKHNSTQIIQRIESLDKEQHSILISPNHHDRLDLYFNQPGILLSEWIVPKGEYFMMGDNRDNSDDSRYWGFVPETNLVGQATAIWMSFDKKEGQWPIGMRLHRIGGIH